MSLGSAVRGLLFALLGMALIKLSTLVVVTASSSRLAKNGELVVATA